MVANVIGGTGNMDAKSAATRRQVSWQYWMAVNAGPTDDTARVDRRLIAARMQCFRLMKAPCSFFLRNPYRTGAQAQERISAPFLFPPQMLQPVCPLTGIWTAPQPLQYVFVTAQLDDERLYTDRTSNTPD
ncbi:hypothetical protein [Bradyrhizobium sp. 23AC]